jgi:hypothetical protein
MIDYELWHVMPDGEVTSVALTGEPISGIRKLVQRFLLAFLQDIASVRYPGKRIPYGTYFMQMLREGKMRSEMDVTGNFMLAKPMIRSALTHEETVDDPPSERYKDATLTGIVLEPGWMKLKITIRSRTDSIDIVLPITV